MSTKIIVKKIYKTKKLVSMRCFFLIAIVLIISITPAFISAQVSSPIVTPLITTSIDKQSYHDGDILTISGTIKSVVSGTPLTIQILDSDNSLVQVAQIDVSADGKYAYTTRATGALWKIDGTYTVKVQYGPPNVTAQTMFTYVKSIIPLSGFSYVKDSNSQQTFVVNYTINGGTIENMTIDPNNLSLFIHVNSTDNGMVTLQIPRILIDAQTNNNQDESFIVLIDDNEVNSQDVGSNSDNRKISIPFLQEDHVIQIIGTKIIPEFGYASSILFMISMTILIAVQYRMRLKNT